MIYTASQTPTETELVATVATWKAVLALRAVPHGAISSQMIDGELMSQVEWRDTATTITHVIGDRDDDTVMRVRLPTEKAAAVVEMASVNR